MKTSVIEVRDLLSVLTVDEVEKRIRNVSGVASATVNYAAGNATVRYDETRLGVADIKVIVHQRGRQSAGESHPTHVSEQEPAPTSAAVPTPEAAAASASAPVAVVPAPAAPAADGHAGLTAQVRRLHPPRLPWRIQADSMTRPSKMRMKWQGLSAQTLKTGSLQWRRRADF